MTPEKISCALRREADKVLSLLCMHDACLHVGEIIPTGSYFMDLMIYPDIDLYLPPAKAEDFLRIAIPVSSYECVRRINFKRGGPGDLKRGLYLKLVIRYGNWQRPWKIDIWSLPMAVVETKQAKLTDLKCRMTSWDRELILQTKHALLTSAGRTPMFSGLHIYEAVIDHHLHQLEAIIEYLRVNGIDVQSA